MGCNCSNNTISLSLKKKLRKKAKEKFAEIKKIWEETSSNNNKISKKGNELKFK